MGPAGQIDQDQISPRLSHRAEGSTVQGAHQAGGLYGPAGKAVPHPAHGADMHGNHGFSSFAWLFWSVVMATSVTRLNRRSRRDSISTPVSSTTKESL